MSVSNCGVCNEWMCVCVGFIMCGCVYAWGLVCVVVCMCNFCSVWVCAGVLCNV